MFHNRIFKKSCSVSVCEMIIFCALLLSLYGADAWKWRNSRPLEQVPISPEVNMTTPQIIVNRGYPSEVHTVITDDGYILELHRIPRGRNEAADPTLKKRAVFLQHGLIGTSCDWVFNPSSDSLPFILADQGYDVWMGNVRGNTYSRNNVRLNPSQEQFWNFSWDETGKYDIPAVINYILSTTGNVKIDYVGHSYGTTLFWIAMITNPALNDKINKMIALAPVSTLAHLRSPVAYLSPFESQIQFGFRLMGGRAFLDIGEPISRAQRNFCDLSVSGLYICRNIMLIIAASNSLNFNSSILPVLFSHNPAGTSVRTVAQFAQNYNSGEAFTQFNYGLWGNLVRYGSVRPPNYDLSKVTAPVYIYWGQNDNLATPEDAQWLAGKLPNVKANNRVPFAMFNHYDFVWAYDAKALLYDSVVNDLKN